jgi:hypothetical protein
MDNTNTYSKKIEIEKELETAYNTILNTTPLTTRLLGPTVEKIGNLVMNGIDQYLEGLKWEIKDKLKTETLEYEINTHKSYLEELLGLYKKTIEMGTYSLDSLELLTKQINKLNPCESEMCLDPDKLPAIIMNTALNYLKATIIKTIKKYAEEIDRTQPNYYDKVSNIDHVITYISTYPVAQAMLGTYLIEWYKEFSKLKEQLKTSNDTKMAMNILESSYQNASNYIKESIELLLKDFHNEREFLERIGLRSILKEEKITDQNRDYVIAEANEIRKAIENVLEALSKDSYKDKNI